MVVCIATATLVSTTLAHPPKNYARAGAIKISRKYFSVNELRRKTPALANGGQGRERKYAQMNPGSISRQLAVRGHTGDSCDPDVESAIPFIYIDIPPMIVISRTTQALIDTLTAFSGNKISRPHDLGILLELGRNERHHTLLDELSFHAKFVRRSYGIMKRIGRDGEGYEKLSAAFMTNLDIVRERIRTLVAAGGGEESVRFEREYLAFSQSGLDNLMSLMYDLEWYKNWQIDHRES
jgi:hypothetical protein